MEVETITVKDEFFEETDDEIFQDDDIISELIGTSPDEEESTSSTVLKYLLNLNEVFNLPQQDIALLKRIKNRLDDTCVPKDAQERLKRLKIHIGWTVPVQHTLESAISNEVFKPRMLMEELKKMNLDFIEMRTDPFTEDEDQSIQRRWQQFSLEYSFRDPAYFIAISKFGGVLPKTEKVKFAQYLGKDLPDRFLCTIFNRFSVLFGSMIKRKFSKEEDKLLLRIKEKNFIKYKSIVSSLLLRRLSVACINRTYILSTPQNLLYGKSKYKWRGFKDDERLVKFIMTKTRSASLEDLEKKPVSITLFTCAASKLHMNCLSALGRWRIRLSTQLFATEPLYKYDLSVKLINWFQEKNYEEWTEIDWDALVLDLHHCQKPFLTALFRSIIAKFNAFYHSYRYDFKNCINYLAETAVPYFESRLDTDVNIERMLTEAPKPLGTLNFPQKSGVDNPDDFNVIAATKALKTNL